MNDMTDVQIAWVAGLMEGEAAFMVVEKRTILGIKYPTFRVSTNMTDEDVLRRAYEYTGIGRFNGPTVPANPKWSPYWRWNITRRDDVAALCRAILPFMGIRRSARIAQVLLAYEESGRLPWRHGTRQAYEIHKCKCDLCRASNTERHRLRRAERRSQASLPLVNDPLCNLAIASGID